MDPDFGHGFIPRIGEENYKAVDRCVGPTDLFSSSLDLPWAIVDGAWAEQKPELLGTLREHGTHLLVDTHGWRYRYESALDVGKLRDASWAPTSPLSPVNKSAAAPFVEASMRAQAELGAGAYFVPGWLPASPDEDLRPAYEHILATASELSVAPKPFVLFVGGHTQGLDQVAALLDDLPHFISGIYLQMTPICPMKVGPSKLEALTSVYQHAASLGFQVIAGHAGAVTPALRALGVDAADAGLAIGENFDQSSAKRRTKPDPDEDRKTGGGRRSRMYFGQIGRSLEASEVERLLAVPGAAAELRACRLPCHRFSGHHLLDQAREHSLRARVEEAQPVNALPPSMRATSVYERLKKQRSTLATINGALEAAGELPLDVKPLDNHIAWISRALAARAAA
ncbi:MAG: hypothetical protein JNK12_16525 [Acidimicrobiales bacterium]|nr:hypothetical protein [Acidimicrobiales bacterium]